MSAPTERALQEMALCSKLGMRLDIATRKKTGVTISRMDAIRILEALEEHCGLYERPTQEVDQ